MKSSRKIFFIILICAALSVFSFSYVAAEELPEGSVKGFPEALTVMDENGNSVSSTGEYFFEVTDMQPNVTYTKKIQIINLRQDEAYHIYFYAQPLSRAGEIDLESNCTCVCLLDGQQVYEGLVTGDGDTDISVNPIDLGLYKPGDSATLSVEITWDGYIDGEYTVDYGSRLVDRNGTTIIREAGGTDYISGETEFKWIFYAVVDTEYEAPQTGVFSQKMIVIYLAAAAVTVIILFLTVITKKRKRRVNEQS